MKVIKIERQLDSTHKKTFFICWTLHDFCNYRCSYCPPGLNGGNRRHIKFEHVKKLYTNLKSKLSSDTKIIIAFSGGEPTLHPEFIEIVKYLRENGCEVTMTSNSGRGLEWWKEIEPYLTHMVFSYHPEFTKFDKFYEKVEYLSQHCWINVDIMMDPDHWDELIGYANEFKKLKRNVGVIHLPIQQNFGTTNEGLLYSYTEEQRQFLANPPNFYGSHDIPKHKLAQSGGKIGRGPATVTYDDQTTERLDYKTLIAKDLNKFNGLTCNIGLEGLILEFEDVYRGYCHVGGKIANLLDDDFDLPIDPVICNKERCACSVDIEVSKY